MDYEYFILDMGSIDQEKFAGQLFFDERVQRVIVAGVKPQEWVCTKYVRSTALCKDAAYIISFASDADVEAVSGAFSKMPLFAGYIPDMFARDQGDLALGYNKFVSEKKHIEKRKQRKQESREEVIMITQYSQKQLTLSEKEKEYAWFHYAAKIIQSGCIDQQMSGYKVTGTGIDGNQVEAELTNEELFQLFSEVTVKYGKQFLNREFGQDLESEEQFR